MKITGVHSKQSLASFPAPPHFFGEEPGKKALYMHYQLVDYCLYTNVVVGTP